MPTMMDYWDARALLGDHAGTDDRIAAELEQRVIVSALGLYMPTHVRLRDGRPVRILEVGCGTGETALQVKHRFATACALLAVDPSAGMIAAAQARVVSAGVGAVTFEAGSVERLPPGPFDLVYTQRCLINIQDHESAIERIMSVLVSGGSYVMCENSLDGVQAINAARAAVSLPAIVPPAHNWYFTDAEIAMMAGPSRSLRACLPFSATYYYHSRVINAALAAREGHAPAYDAQVNQLAAQLPADCVSPRFAQGRLWIWAKP